MKVSKKSLEIPPFIVMEVLEAAQKLEAAGIDVVHMEVGEPDFDSPPCVIDRGIESLRQGRTHYTHSMGKLSLRESIARYHDMTYGTPVSPDRIIVTGGSSPALLLVFMALCDPGDEIILPNPYYPCYPNIIRFSEGTPVFVDVFEENGFQYTPEAIAEKITDRTRAILINSPSNPTGNLLSPEVMVQIANIGVPVVSDEIYHGLVYGKPARSILEFSDNAVVIGGFSKLFAMTGWRLGYCIVPEELARPIQKMQQNFFISAGDFVQEAGEAALFGCGDEITEMVAEYARRRELVLSRLTQMGFSIKVEPHGAFYVFLNVKELCAKTGKNSYDLAFDILDRAHLAVTPGTDFGPGGEGFIRFSYATKYERIVEGMNRFENYLSSMG